MLAPSKIILTSINTYYSIDKYIELALSILCSVLNSAIVCCPLLSFAASIVSACGETDLCSCDQVDQTIQSQLLDSILEFFTDPTGAHQLEFFTDPTAGQ